MIGNFKDIIKARTEACRVTTLGEAEKYSYAILPLESRFDFIYLDAVTNGLAWMLRNEMKKTDAIVGIEAKGFLIAPSLAKKCKKDCVIVRKRDYKTKDQLVINHKTVYGNEENLFCVGLKKGEKVIILDDMVSGGDTLKSVAKKLIENGNEIICLATLYDRGEGRKSIKNEIGLSTKSLVTIDVVNGKTKVLKFHPENSL